MTGVALIVFHGSAQLPSTEQKWVKLDGAHWPIEILPELQAIEKSRPRGTPIFNDMLFGGFLIYHTPGLRVFIDDRCELYGDEFMIKYVKAERSDYEAWGKAYRFDLPCFCLTQTTGSISREIPTGACKALSCGGTLPKTR